jgi:hypothetical protein
VTATNVEFLGNADHVLFPAPGASSPTEPGAVWTAKIDADCPAAAGDELSLGVDVDGIHLFEAATGLALPRTGAPAVTPATTPALAAA